MPLNNFGLVTTMSNGARLWRCAQPDAHGFKQLFQMGVTDIIKLNDDGEYLDNQEKSFFQGSVHLRPLPRLFLIPPETTIRRIVEKIVSLQRAGGQCVVHCTHGIDRTGLIIGAYRVIQQKWSFEAVQKERYEYGATKFRDIPDARIVDFLKCLSSVH